jgi:hypothetical protein
MFAEKLDKEPEWVSWDDHYEALTEQVLQNFEYCNRLLIAEDLGKGEYKEGGLVLNQFYKKAGKDAEKPSFEFEIDPSTRYSALAMPKEKIYSRKALDDQNWVHPIVAKALAKKAHYELVSKGGGAKGDIDYTGKKLLSVEGKAIVAAQSGYTYTPPARKSVASAETLASPKPMISKEEVERKSETLKESLLSAVLAHKMDDHVQAGNTLRRQRSRTEEGLLSQSQETMDEIGHVPPADIGEGIADQTAAMWDRMHEKHLSPSQQAELAHIRHMITALNRSLESYKQAEKDMLMGARK